MEEISTKFCDPSHRLIASHICHKCNMYLCDDCTMNKHYNSEHEVKDLESEIINSIMIYQKHHQITQKCLSFTKQQMEGRVLEEVIEEKTRETREAYGELRSKLLLHRDNVKEEISNSSLVTNLREEQQKMRESLGEQLPNLKGELSQIIDSLHWASKKKKFIPILHLLSTSEEEVNQTASSMQEKVESFKGYQDKQSHFRTELQKISRSEVIYHEGRVAANLDKIAVLKSNLVHSLKLYLFLQNSNKFYIYNAREQICMEESFKSYTIPYNFGLGECKGRIFLIGGNLRPNIFLRKCTEVIATIGGIVEHMEMESPRRRIGVAVISKYIYAIGGDSDEGYSRKVERFDIEAESWGKQPNLSEGKTNCMACSFNQRYIYCFGGYDNIDLASIECLDTLHTTQGGWKALGLHMGPNWGPIQNCGCMQLSDQQILIFGGYKQGACSNDAFLFNTQLLEIKNISPILDSDTFLQSSPKLSNGKIYAIGCHKSHLHIFDVKNMSWDILRKSDWCLL